MYSITIAQETMATIMDEAQRAAGNCLGYDISHNSGDAS
jgi:hypothetical protein